MSKRRQKTLTLSLNEAGGAFVEAKYVPITQAAQMLGVSIDTLRRWDKRGLVSSVRPTGTTRYFAIRDVKKIIKEGAPKLSAPIPIVKTPAATKPVKARKPAEHYANAKTEAVPMQPQQFNTSAGKNIFLYMAGLTAIFAAVVLVLFWRLPSNINRQQPVAGTKFGSGLSEENGTLSVDAKTIGTTNTTATNSGLEVTSEGVRILGGCKDGQILKWNASSLNWECQVDGGNGTSTITNTTVGFDISLSDQSSSQSNVNKLQLGPTSLPAEQFVLSNLQNGQARLELGSQVALLNKDQTVTGNWSFSNITCNDCVNLGSETSGDYVATITTSPGLSGGMVGEGSSPTLSLDVLTSGTTTNTSSNSGLEIANDGLRLIGGCSDTQVLKFNSTSLAWECANDVGGTGGTITVAESDGSPVVASTSTLQFGSAINSSDEFTVTNQGAGVSRVRLGSTVLLTTNYSSTLDPIYVNASESPVAGDITGSFSGGLNIGANSVALGTDTVGNYIATITSGNGISGNSASEGGTPTIALGSLTADWSQAGAFDIVLNNSSSELKILESVGGTFYGIFDIGDLSADQTFTFSQGGTVITSSNINNNAVTSVSADAGLTGGGGPGAISLAVGAGAGISVNANDIAVIYGSGANSAAAGSNTFTCASGSGNLTGGGTVVTIGTSGTTCAAITTNPAVSFGTSVTTPLLQNTGALNISANTSVGADDIIFNTAGTESLRILEGGNLFFEKGVNDVTFAVATPGAAATYTFSGVTGTVLTTGNYSGSLDGVYVNVGESPAVADIGGSFSTGLTINANSVALATDTVGDYVASFTAGNGLTGSATGEGSTPTLAVVSANGAIVANADNIALTLISAADALSATTSSGSGLEVVATGLTLIQGCSDTQVLKWNETTDTWGCAADATGSSTTWDTIGDPASSGSIAMAEFAQTLDWNTGAVAGAFDGLSITITNDATSDSTTQRGLVVKNNSATGGTTETLLVIDNADDSAVTTALQILGSSTGAITTAIDVSDAEIGVAIALGANDITGSVFNVTGATGNVSTGTITSGLINGQTITATASLTGSLSVATTLGVTGATTLSSTLAVTGTSTYTGLATFNGGLTVELGDTFTFNADAFTDLTGTGLQIVTGALQTTLGTSVQNSEVDDNLTISSTGLVDWLALTNYPAACVAGSAVSTLADAPTCTAFNTDTSISLQDAYASDADGSDTIIALTTADDSLIFRNPDVGGSDSTFVLKVEQLNAGAVDGLIVNHAGTGFALRVNDDGTDSDSTPFVINQDGRVGIGTTAPNEKLEVRGTVNGSFPGLLLANTEVALSSTNETVDIALDFGTAGYDTNNPAGRIRLGKEGDFFTSSLDEDSYLSFATMSDGTTTDRLRLTSTGNFGIGDNSPAALLTVGAADAFQVNSSGAIAAATGVTSSGTITFSGLNCTANTNGGALTASALGVISCSDDDGGGTATTLQQSYGNDADGSDTIIALTTADDSLIFRNPSSAGTDSGYVTWIDQLNIGAVDGLRVSNAGTGTIATFDATGTGTTADGILIRQTSTGTITDAIDASDETITNALNVGANNITGTTYTLAGTTAVIDFSNFDLNGDGDIRSAFTTLNGSSTANGSCSIAPCTSLALAVGGGTNFDVGNYVKIDSTNCVSGVNSCYAKITAKATDTLTISPALMWAASSAVTEVHVPEVGGTNLTNTLTNRYGRGYFIDGVVTGNGSTTYTDGAVTSNYSSFSLLNTSVTTLNIGGAATSVTLGASGGSVTIPGTLVAGALQPSGAGSLTFGNVSTTSISLLTDGTGDGEVVLPTGSVSGTEILDNSVVLTTDTVGDYIANLGTLTGLSTTGNSGEGSTPTLSVIYGSAANNAAAGSNSFTCATGSGNLTGGGTTVTLGTSGTACAAITTNAAVSFGTSVTSPLLTNAGTLTLSATGAGNDITLTSADQIILTGFDCTTFTNGGALTVSATGVLGCSNDDGGAAGSITGTGTTNRITYFSGTSTIADSWLAQNVSTLELDTTRNLSLLGGNLSVTGTGAFSGLLTVTGNLTVETGDTLTVNGDAFTDLTGTGLQIVTGILQATLGTSISNGEIDIDAVTLATQTTGNYVASITNGNGISGSSSTEGGTPTIALSNLTADWTQAGAFDVVLNNAASEIKILESVGGLFYGIFDIGDLSADQTFTFTQGGTVLTTGNVASNAVTSVTAGTGLTGGGGPGAVTLDIGAGAGITVNANDIAVIYGSTANTAVQGNVSLTCPSGAGNLTGGGTAITLGTGGTCGNLNTVNNPTFTTSVTTPILSSAAALTLTTAATLGADDIIFQTAGTEKLRVLENGELLFEKGINDVTITVAAPGAATTYTFSGTSGTVLTTANYASNLDSTYVNTGESPAAGDITGSFTAGLSVGANSVALTTDTTGDYVASFTAGNGLTGSSTGEGSTPTLAVVSANGAIVANADNIALTLISSADALSSTTSTASGLEVLASGLTLIQGCADTQILKWNETSDTWACAADATGGSPTFDTIGDPSANGSIVMAEFAQSFDWNTDNATAAAFDGLTISITNDATTDTNIQRGLVVKNNSATGGTTETLVVLENADNNAVTTGLQIVGSSTGAITTAIDASDAEIVTALAIGANEITGTNFNVTSSGTVSIAAGTNTESALNIGRGWANAIKIDPSVEGIIINESYTTAATQTSALTGLALDFNTNFTGAQAAAIIGVDLSFPGLSVAGSVTNYTGFNIGAATSLVTNPGTINWNGASFTMPNITQTSGTITSNGLKLTTGAITTGGIQNALNIVAQGASAGTLSGINFGSITTPGAGTENSIIFGSGWDTNITTTAGVALNIDSGTTGAINIGTNANAKAQTIGNTTAGSTLTLRASTTAGNLSINGVLTSGSNGNQVCNNSSSGAFTQAASCAQVSVRSSKSNVNNLSGLEMIDSLQPVSFDYISDGSRHYGFIADDVAEVDKTFVAYNNDGSIYGLYYNEFIALAIAGIKEVNSKVDANEAIASGGLKTLDERVSGLEYRVSRIENNSNDSSGSSTNNGQEIDLSNLTVGTLAVELDLIVKGSMVVDGLVTFKEAVRFQKDAIFDGNVTINGTASFNNNTGGLAKIAVGEQRIRIVFSKPYATVPVITISLGDGKFATYSYRDVSEAGFEIILKDVATEDLNFSWIATSVNDVKTITSRSP